MSQKTLDPAQVENVPPGDRRPKPVLSASLAVLPARIFLGIVFLYAGIDKLTDPEFFNPAASGYIGNQLAGFATISPIGGFLTSVAVPNATLFGWLAALGEIAIGLGTLTGLFSRVAALAGMFLSLTLWLSASWATEPFYLGSDLPYAVFFLVLAVGGSHPVWSLDGQLAQWLVRRKAAEYPEAFQYNEREELVPVVTQAEAAGLARRRFLAVTGATIAAGTFGIVAWGNALAGRTTTTTASIPGSTTPSGAAATATVPATTAAPATTASATTTQAPASATPAASPTTAAPATTTAPTSAVTATTTVPNTTAAPVTTAATPATTVASATTAAPATTAAAAVQGTVLTTLSALPSGTGKSFTTPDTKQPFLVIRGDGNTVHAFSAICTHQGCTVAFNQSANSIICPCHGAQYNPATGAATKGPATRALATINVQVDANGNVVYVTK